MHAGNDLLNALQAFERGEYAKLWLDLGVATLASAVLCAVFIVLWRRVRGPFRDPRRPIAFYIGVVAGTCAVEAWLLFGMHPVEPRERFAFIDVPSENSFATLAIFTEIPKHLHQNENGIFHIYARAYYSTRPDAIAAVRISADSPWLNLSKVSQRDLTSSTFGKTRGADVGYEYRPDNLGTHALREHFAVTIKGAANAKSGRPIVYSALNVENVDVVKPFSLYELMTNPSIWQIAVIVVPLLIAALGLSRKPDTVRNPALEKPT